MDSCSPDILPWNDLASTLRLRFGCRVQKLTLDAGMTCPNRDGTHGKGGCVYCNANGSGNGSWPSHTITEQIVLGKAAIRRRYPNAKFLAYFQGFTNTYAPLEILRSRWEEALSDTDVVGLIIGTRPDCVPDTVLDLLTEFAERTSVTVEYGLQSANDATLARINRGHDFAAFADAVARTRLRGFETGVHLILGLPGETREDMLATATTIACMDIQAVKIHLLYVVRETILHRWYEEGKYRCLEREEYADLVAEVVSLLPPAMVIHRLTGDPHRDELIAPSWALDKTATLAAIRDAFRQKETWQGRAWGNDAVENGV